MDELEKFKAFLQQIANNQAAFERDFDAGITTLLSHVIEQITQLEWRSAGVFDGGRVKRNLVKLAIIRANIKQFLMKSTIVKTLLNALNWIAEYGSQVDEYFLRISSKNILDRSLLNQIIASTKVGLEEQLLKSGIDTYLVNPVMAKLQGGIGGDFSRTKMIAEVKGLLTPGNRLNRWAKQTVSDAMNGFVANYQQTQAKQLGIGHYLYDGVTVKDSRAFCVARKGRVFTEDEIKSWASGSWAGKNPATDSHSIFIYRGGYGCIDHLRPIPESLYKILKSRGK